MDKEFLLKQLLETFDSVNVDKITTTLKLSLKGENLLLLCLHELGGRSTPGKLVEKLDYTAARLSAVIKSLENKGFVKRMKDIGDRRSTIVSITAEGKAHFERLKQEILKNAGIIIENLGEDDVYELLRIVKKLSTITNSLT